MNDLQDLQQQREPFSLDALVQIANHLLPRYLPEAVDDARVRGEVNPRLVRHLTTLGVLDDALREGREARYTQRHLLQLLVARRLMAEGYSTGSVKKVTAVADNPALEGLLQGGAHLAPDSNRMSRESHPTPPPGGAVPSAIPVSRGAVASPSAPQPAPAPAPEPTDPALAYMQRLKHHRQASSDTALSSPAPSPMPPTSPSSPPPGASQWMRVEVVPGLEIQVREDFVLPPTPHERDQLLQSIWGQLKSLSPRVGASKRGKTYPRR